jgi:signal peptidase II
MVWILIVIIGAAADQFLKATFTTMLASGESIPVIDGFFYLVLRTNPGAAWSFLADKEWGGYVLIAVSSIASAAMLIFILKYPDRRIKACLAFLCAGSVGNLIDRIRFGSVTDYLDFHFGSYVFPTFNLADTLIVCSSIVLGILVLFGTSPQPATTEAPLGKKD